MPSSRSIISILIIAQLIGYALFSIVSHLRTDLAMPLVSLALGGLDPSNLQYGPIRYGEFIATLAECLFTLLLGLPLLKLLLSMCWRWIPSMLPEIEPQQRCESGPSTKGDGDIR